MLGSGMWASFCKAETTRIHGLLDMAESFWECWAVCGLEMGLQASGHIPPLLFDEAQDQIP